MHRFLLVFVIVIAFGLMTMETYAQCAMCKAVVESSSQGAGMLGGETNIGSGLNKGIIFLMVIPYILLFILFRKKLRGFFKEMSQAQG